MTLQEFFVAHIADRKEVADKIAATLRPDEQTIRHPDRADFWRGVQRRAEFMLEMLCKRLLALKCRSFALPGEGELPLPWRA